MSRYIYKYPLNLHGTMALPKNAKLLHVQVQGGVIMLWAEITENLVKVVRRVPVYGAGEELPADPGTYVGTVVHGDYVWHVYDLGETGQGVPEAE